jgi:hypothetical protein
MSNRLRKNKSAFVRGCPVSMPEREVVERALRLHGLTISEAFVTRVRRQAATTHRRGFKAMDRDLVVDISGIGGIVGHQRGVAHEFNHREAVSAGSKGGLASARNRRLRKEGLLPPLKSGTPTTPNARRTRPMVTLTLSPEALARLDGLRAERGQTRSGAVEALIRNARLRER